MSCMSIPPHQLAGGKRMLPANGYVDDDVEREGEFWNISLVVWWTRILFPTATMYYISKYGAEETPVFVECWM